MGCMRLLSTAWRFRKSFVIVLTPILLLPLPLVGKTSIANCAYVLCLMATYWTTEACPLAATSLLPIILFPALGVLTADQVSMSYTRQLNFLFIGGLIIAVAIEEWNLHRRIALKVLMLIGSKPCWVLLGFMTVTSLLSMWLSNTATAAMMVPIAMAVHKQMVGIKVESKADEELVATVSSYELAIAANEVKEPEEGNRLTAGRKTCKMSQLESTSLRKAMLLCVAYSANIGGFATLIGTPSNLVLPGALDAVFGENASSMLDFVSWIGFCLPVSIVCLALSWIWLQIRFIGIRTLFQKSDPEADRRVSDYIKRAYAELGPIRFGECAVLGHFTFLVLLWLTRDPKIITGWKDALGWRFVKDSTSAILVSFSFFVFPSENPIRFLSQSWKTSSANEAKKIPHPSPPLLSWKSTQSRLAWDVVLLLGAGFALAKGCAESGLTNWVGEKMLSLSSIPPAAFALIISIIVSLLTEFTSNVSTASIFLPVLCKLASHNGIHPLYVAIPATISCSFAFSLPVATPPNAIAFSYGSLKVRDLVSTGLILNFICVFVLNLFLNTSGVAIFKLDQPFTLLSSNTTSVPTNTTIFP